MIFSLLPKKTPNNQLPSVLVLDKIRQGYRTAGEIKDATGLTYPQIWGAIALLESQGKVKSYFADTLPSPTLSYRVIL